MQPPNAPLVPNPSPAVDTHRITYLRVTSGNLTEPTESAAEDARRLVGACIEPLKPPKRFPPQLFILWITPRFFPRVYSLLDAIHDELGRHNHAEVPLI